VRPLAAADAPAVQALAERLRRWFSPADLAQIAALLRTRPSGWLAVSSIEGLLGFLLDAPTPDPAVREIAWMGVDPAWHDRGVGTLLLDRLLSAMHEAGVRELVVSTVAESAGYAPYIATRAFYHARGFVDDHVEPDYYWPGGDRLVLRRPVRDADPPLAHHPAGDVCQDSSKG
jgi:ribosomal protein S18 acetylase RimI-like enzyme